MLVGRCGAGGGDGDGGAVVSGAAGDIAALIALLICFTTLLL